jgi:preprotein translocase subunit YajC
MEKNGFILIIFVLAFLVIIIFMIIKNHKDRKGLFKKLPGDYPDPKNVESEFDFKD